MVKLDLPFKLPSLLVKWGQEISATGKKDVSVPVIKPPAPDATRSTTAIQKHAERILHCASVPNASSTLIFKLSAEKARITDIFPRKPAPPLPPSKGGNNADALKTRRLDLGNYRQCPHCINESIVFCGVCGSLACTPFDAHIVTCPVCGNTGPAIPKGINLEFSRKPQAQNGGIRSDNLLSGNQKPSALLTHRKG